MIDISLKSYPNDSFYQFLFQQTKKDFENDDFFDIFDINETLKIQENSFEAIVKELEIYNLSKTSDDVKGIAFEKFIGKTFREELGQFFTPRTIVDFMVEVLAPPRRGGGEKICDPCCGSGGFLIKAFQYVRSKISGSSEAAGVAARREQEAKLKIKSKNYTQKYEQLSETEKAVIAEPLAGGFGGAKKFMLNLLS